MARKNIFSGIISVIVVAAFIFWGVFFLYPDVSMKYFGTAFNSKAVGKSIISSTVAESEFLSSEEKKSVEEVFSSKEANEALKKITEAAGNGTEAVEKAMEDESVQKLWKSLEGAVSKENLEKFASEAGSKFSSIYERLFR